MRNRRTGFFHVVFPKRTERLILVNHISELKLRRTGIQKKKKKYRKNDWTLNTVYIHITTPKPTFSKL